MHIAILMANTDESAFAQRHPKDGEKFRNLLAPLRPDWRFTTLSVKDGTFPSDLSDYDGFIITGSPASVHDDAPWVHRLMQLIRDIRTAKLPLYGACFGHQAIALALGGRVEKNPGGWVFGLTETQMEGAPIHLYAAHVEQVTNLPQGAEPLGGNADCAIGAYRIGGQVLTTQYHPEITESFATALVEEYYEKLPPEVAKRAKQSLTRPAETERMAQRIVDFFESA
ncbi:type 1 glutamine amidotransferase [Xinfangfangia sp. CPCC 101601]|uniref:Type 1 glutamine amidotransferase n=1 Tax=Pseudogemmobacter lacusdianii TaxID=3069608 RepID=A0ABU0VU78_9RHOB|nr:type 1 glutamine amidotransferase [Xinfangfangia sp. CPCC 101601]MDQ2065268.1 type 1 glutamine amidotransferase [Xinfangfangia sp. CPCC 101601]